MRWFVEDRGYKTPCWVWDGVPTDAGYATVSIGKRTHLVHRLMYVLYVGPIHATREIDHLCRVRNCVNPDHLEAVPHVVNQQRTGPATKTHCKRGHLLSGDNLMFVSTRPTWRICRTCRNERRRVGGRP